MMFDPDRFFSYFAFRVAPEAYHKASYEKWAASTEGKFYQINLKK